MVTNNLSNNHSMPVIQYRGILTAASEEPVRGKWMCTDSTEWNHNNDHFFFASSFIVSGAEMHQLLMYTKHYRLEDTSGGYLN